MDTQHDPTQSFPFSLRIKLKVALGAASKNKMRGCATPRTLLSLTVSLLDRTQLLEQLLVGESGHHEELILGKEVIDELLLHFSCLVRTKKTGVRNEQGEESKAVVMFLLLDGIT